MFIQIQCKTIQFFRCNHSVPELQFCHSENLVNFASEKVQFGTNYKVLMVIY